MVEHKSILVTGSKGFIGKNLVVKLRETPGNEVLEWHRGSTLDDLQRMVGVCDAVVHLAGENRPQDEADFRKVNVGVTEALCGFVAATGRRIPILFSSSRQAELENPYGRSKREAEELLSALAERSGAPCVAYRLPGVFGKWARPNYNSVVATFCHNLARDLPVRIDDPSKRLELVYIDDVVDEFVRTLAASGEGFRMGSVEPIHVVTLGEIAGAIERIRASRENLLTEPVGTGFLRALYSTYTSYLPTERFSYDVKEHIDKRGKFVEMLRTRDSGQLSYFTAHPGITRGGHYHHTKIEKFLVLSGQARFRFRNVANDEHFELTTSGEESRIVESIPGWSHDITNVGQDTLVVMLWASEIFDPARPDTFASKVWNE